LPGPLARHLPTLLEFRMTLGVRCWLCALPLALVLPATTVSAQSVEPATTAPATTAPAAPDPEKSAAGETARLLPSRPIGGARLTEPALSALPAAATWWSLIETADGNAVVDRIDNGGLYLGEPALIGMHGSSWTQAGFVMDGLDLTNPGSPGTPFLFVDPRVLESVSVDSVMLPPELGGGGPTITLTPRAPASRWDAELRGSFLPHALQASAPESVAPVAEFASAADGDLLLSGPLTVGGGAGLLVSGRLARSGRFERGETARLDGRVASLFAVASFKPSADTHGRVMASVDGLLHPFAGRARFADRNVSQRDNQWHAHTTWEHTGALGWSATVGYQRADHAEPTASADPGPGTVERLLDGPVPALFAVGAGSDERVDARLGLQAGAGPLSNRRHQARGGASVTRAATVADPMVPGTVGELVDGVPARVWSYQDAGIGSRRTLTELAAWGEDTIRPVSRLRVDAGVRFESTSGSSRDGDGTIAWRGLEPRLSAQLLINARTELSLYGSYASYRHRLPLEYLAYGDRGAPSGRIFRWFDTNGDHRVQPNEVGPLVATIGPGPRGSILDSIDPNLHPPRTDEQVVGMTARIRGWTGHLAAVHRSTRWLVAPVDVGVTAADYTPVEVFDRGNNFLDPSDDRWLTIYNRNPASAGLDRDVLTNPPEHDGHYYGVELSAERVFDGRWFTMLSGSAHRTDGLAANRGFRANENDTGVLGELFEDPNALTYARGRLFVDRGYVLKWATAYLAASDWQVGVVARYQDGQHFARMVVADGLTQGRELIQAYTKGHSRFTFTFTLDARIEKRWKVAGRRLSAVVEVFNLLNTANEVEEDPVTTREFRAPTALQPPRAVRFGLGLGLW
jgi:hypothetical protein